jgi:hypothetical protein
MLIHVSGAGASIFLSVLNDFKQFKLVIDIFFCEVFNETRLLFGLPDFKIVFADVQQISDFLHVELEN